MSATSPSATRPPTATTVTSPAPGLTRSSTSARLRDPTYQGYTLMRIVFSVAPILFGADKFANVMVNWERYLAPWIAHASPLSKIHTMHIVGVIEILAGVAVAIKPRYGALLVAAWLGGIVINLLSYSGYYDIALRDFGLMMGALALSRIATRFDPPELTRPAPL